MTLTKSRIKPEFNHQSGSHVEEKVLEAEGRLSLNDPHSYANIEDVITTHIHIELETLFIEDSSDAIKLEGFVILYLTKKNKNAKTVRIDARELNIESISDEDSKKELEWKMVRNVIEDEPSRLGDLVEITLPETQKSECKIHIKYHTNECDTNASPCGHGGIYYYSRIHIVGDDDEKIQTIFFTQGQAINTRTWIPCQDTPSAKVTYTAVITGPEKFKALMSAPLVKTFYTKPEHGEEKKRVSTFKQTKPISTYLIIFHH